uniref:Uncharacterized protein n=1 Tax=Arundo donax TaxID=35708 RepID=A0A0A8Z2E9_ARUDO
MVALKPVARSQLPTMVIMLHGGDLSWGRCACTDSSIKPASSMAPKARSVQKQPR